MCHKETHNQTRQIQSRYNRGNGLLITAAVCEVPNAAYIVTKELPLPQILNKDLSGRFEVLTTVKITTLFFRVVTP
jgi:hypothetical protein